MIDSRGGFEFARLGTVESLRLGLRGCISRIVIALPYDGSPRINIRIKSKIKKVRACPSPINLGDRYSNRDALGLSGNGIQAFPCSGDLIVIPRFWYEACVDSLGDSFPRRRLAMG